MVVRRGPTAITNSKNKPKQPLQSSLLWVMAASGPLAAQQFHSINFIDSIHAARPAPYLLSLLNQLKKFSCLWERRRERLRKDSFMQIKITFWMTNGTGIEEINKTIEELHEINERRVVWGGGMEVSWSRNL